MTLYLLLAPISLLFNLFVILTSPVWALIAATFRLETLPGPLGWVHTHDNNIYGGGAPTRFKDRFMTALWWLVRNPGYGFDAYVLGFAGHEITDQTKTQSGAFSTGQAAIRRDTMQLTGGRERFSYRRDVPLGRGRYIKLWFGWHYQDQAGRRMLKFDINPFKRAN